MDFNLHNFFPLNTETARTQTIGGYQTGYLRMYSGTLKGLSNEMDGDIQVKCFSVKGPVHNLHLQISALYQILYFK